MGLWDMLKQQASAQFLDVIEWLDDSRDTIVYRFPVFNQAITRGSKLVVREGQIALFVAEGVLSEPFGPGTYTLDTKNEPILAFFESIRYAFETPYKGDVYFVSTREFNAKWGTPSPIIMRDAEFGPVRLRAFGNFAYRVTPDRSREFLRQIVGTDGLFTTDEIHEYLRRKLIATFASTIGESKLPVLDFAANYTRLADTLRVPIERELERFGVALTDLNIENIGLPAEVEKALDERTKMGVIGNLGAYTALKSADAIGTAAANPGLAGAGVGLGAGIALGGAVTRQFTHAENTFDPRTQAAPPPLPSSRRFHYAGPTGQAELTVAEIAERVGGDRGGEHLVWAPGWSSWKKWSEVPEIAAALPAAPPPVPAARFHYNGPGGDGEKSAAEIAAIVAAHPNAEHYVWRQGWDGWRPAKDVAELRSAAGNVPPPPPRPSAG